MELEFESSNEQKLKLEYQINLLSQQISDLEKTQQLENSTEHFKQQVFELSQLVEKLSTKIKNPKDRSTLVEIRTSIYKKRFEKILPLFERLTSKAALHTATTIFVIAVLTGLITHPEITLKILFWLSKKSVLLFAWVVKQLLKASWWLSKRLGNSFWSIVLKMLENLKPSNIKASMIESCALAMKEHPGRYKSCTEWYMVDPTLSAY